MKKISFLILILLFILGINVYAYSFGPGASKNHQRPIIDSKLRKIIEENNGVYIGDDTKNIYLTFDCGYENGYTPIILDTLKRTNTKAIFFITEHYLLSAEDLVKRMIDEGHMIGNHTSKHRDFSNSSKEMILEDVTSLEKLFYEKMGVNMSNFVRPPRGEFTLESQKLLAKHGYRSVFWSLAYVDWNKDTYNGNHYSYNKVMERIHNGAIILMHTVSKDNALDLEDIIVKLKEEGYIFETMDYLFRPRFVFE